MNNSLFNESMYNDGYDNIKVNGINQHDTLTLSKSRNNIESERSGFNNDRKN